MNAKTQMPPSQYLFARTKKEGEILLSGKNHKIALIGSTVQTNAHIGEFIESFSVFPRKDWIDIIAVAVQGLTQYFLIVSKFHSKIFLDKEWVPKRPAQVFQNCLAVEVDGLMFVSRRDAAEKMDGIFFPDSTILCRFLCGQVDTNEVLAIAEDSINEHKIRQQLQEELQDARQRLKMAISDLDASRKSEARLVEERNKQKTQLNGVLKIIRQHRLARLLLRKDLAPYLEKTDL